MASKFPHMPVDHGLTYADFERTGEQDCGNTFSFDDVDFSSGNTGEEIVDNSLQLMEIDDWIAQNDDFDDLNPKKAYAAWKAGWRACAIRYVDAKLENHLTKAETLFEAALDQPGVQSLEVCQDIALENKLSLADLGEKFAKLDGYYTAWNTSFGTFTWKSHELYSEESWVRWEVQSDRRNSPGSFTISMRYSFHGNEWDGERLGLDGGGMQEDLERMHKRKVARDDVDAYALRGVRSRACAMAWHAVRVLKEQDATGKPFAQGWQVVVSERLKEDPVDAPEELFENPSSEKMDPEDQFWAAVDDPEPGSMEVAQDIALEHGWTLADMGEKMVRFATREKGDVSVGEFYYEDHENLSQGRRRPGGPWINGGAWHISTVMQGYKGMPAAFVVEMRYQYRHERWDWRIKPGGNVNTFSTLAAARRAAVLELWRALRIMKDLDPTTETYIYGLKQSIAFAAENDERVIPAELRNPGTKKMKIKQEDRAVDKYREFNSFDPKDLVYVDGSPIPAKLRCLGEATQIIYESMKVIPDNGVKPRKPQGYFHDHEGDVHTYVPDPNGDTDTPDFVLECDALALIGTCIEFAYKDEDGKKGKGKATKPFPEVYCTPNGRALLIIQSKKTVLAIIYGGALGVESRGIVG